MSMMVPFLNMAKKGATPIGSVIEAPWGLPVGNKYEPLDGSTLLKADYPDLHGILSEELNKGVGDTTNITTFTSPTVSSRSRLAGDGAGGLLFTHYSNEGSDTTDSNNLIAALYHSADYGATWTTIHGPTGDSASHPVMTDDGAARYFTQLLGVAPDTFVGVVYCNGYVGNSGAKRVVLTADGGYTWTDITSPEMDNGYFASYAYASSKQLSIVNDQLVFSYSQNYVFRGGSYTHSVSDLTDVLAMRIPLASLDATTTASSWSTMITAGDIGGVVTQAFLDSTSTSDRFDIRSTPFFIPETSEWGFIVYVRDASGSGDYVTYSLASTLALPGAGDWTSNDYSNYHNSSIAGRKLQTPNVLWAVYTEDGSTNYDVLQKQVAWNSVTLQPNGGELEPRQRFPLNFGHVQGSGGVALDIGSGKCVVTSGSPRNMLLSEDGGVTWFQFNLEEMLSGEDYVISTAFSGESDLFFTTRGNDGTQLQLWRHQFYSTEVTSTELKLPNIPGKYIKVRA